MAADLQSSNNVDVTDAVLGIWQFIFVGASLCLLGAILGASVMYRRARREKERLQTEVQNLSLQLEYEKELRSEKAATIDALQKELEKSFLKLSKEALNSNNENFLLLAKEKLSQYQDRAKADLSEKEKAIKTLLQPIRETLNKTESHIQESEKERQKNFGSLEKHLELMGKAETLLREETQKLVKALHRPEVRGRWGELTLKRIAELAGMVNYCDFYEQQSGDTDSRMRPDMVVRMPDRREIIVDAKTPLDAYLDATQTDDDTMRKSSLARHTRNVRERVRELASKAYWNQFKHSPDFVVLFIPGEQFLSAALEQDPQLLEDALNEQVILATPTSIVALLRAVAFGWRQLAVEENAEEIRKLGEQLYERLATFTEHLQKLGKNLDVSVNHFNRATGSLNRNVLSGARKFTQLGINPKKSLTEPREIENRPITTD